MITDRLIRLTTGALTAAALTGLSFTAGAVSTHHYIDDTSGFDAQAVQEQTAGETAPPMVGPAHLVGARPDSRVTQTDGKYRHIPKVGHVRVDTG